MPNNWICCQLGAREHYVNPRALFKLGRLDRLITDTWVRPNSLLTKAPMPRKQGLLGRYHRDLGKATVVDFTVRSLFHEMMHLGRGSTWTKIIARNDWYQAQALAYLKKHTKELPDGNQTVVFAYDYVARTIFRHAKERGWLTVLEQVDPGIVEEEIVRAEHDKNPDLETEWRPAPRRYWSEWEEECDLSDRIVVTSDWSQRALETAGIARNKIRVIPLAYETTTKPINRTYPSRFSKKRPLRVLFLGQVNLRKGIARLLEAARGLGEHPIEFRVVGPCQISLTENHRRVSNIRWFGPTPRMRTAGFYRESDVFILPTLSDGFALTQLEAQAWRLPIIASRNCGEVVRDGENGLILPEVTEVEIQRAILKVMDNPSLLQRLAANSWIEDKFTLKALGDNLTSLEEELISARSR